MAKKDKAPAESPVNPVINEPADPAKVESNAPVKGEKGCDKSAYEKLLEQHSSKLCRERAVKIEILRAAKADPAIGLCAELDRELILMDTGRL